MLDELTTDERRARITQLIQDIGRPKNVIADEIGVTNQAVTGWEKTGRIGRKASAMLCAMAGRPPSYLIVRDWNGGAGEAKASPEERVLHLEALIAGLCVWIRETIPTGVPSLVDHVETARRLAQADPLHSVFGVVLEGLGAESPSARSASRGGARSGKSKAGHP